MKIIARFILIAVMLMSTAAGAEELANRLALKDVFGLEWASDPQISPDGEEIVYVRNSMDIMADARRSNLWIVNFDGTEHRPLTTGEQNNVSPRWSPDGKRLLYASTTEGSLQLYVRWMDTGQTTKLAQLTQSPLGFSWSPDGRWIAFSMLVPEPPEPFAEMPQPPKGATWADPAKVTRDMHYRMDALGYLESGSWQIFVLPAEGGTPRQLTTGPFHHGGIFSLEVGEGPSWTPDSRSLLISANLREDWEHELIDTEIYEVSLIDGALRALTDRRGPDIRPLVSPDGRSVAFVGFDDRYQGYQITELYLMDREGNEPRCLTCGFDRDIEAPQWSADSQGLYFQYDDRGNTKIGFIPLDGKPVTLAEDLGSGTIGRPYGPFGQRCYSVARDGRFAFTTSSPHRPSDLAVGRRGSTERQKLTGLNDDLLGHKELGAVEEIWFESSYDERRVQGWIVRPPDFDPEEKYPLILEIHGGPFANYGDRFTTEVQLYAAADYVVLYLNPRGSTSYGEEFGNLIHHNYPGQDYDDLISGVDAVLERGFVDPDRLYVTGGSGGGILTAWIVGKTDRFRAAVVAKPIVNWISAELTTDFPSYTPKYWFPGFSWDKPEEYLRRSPLSLVGNVSTPTMLMNGEEDYRTPIAESEQFYTALKLRKVDTALVRFPGASHWIAARPSQLMAKVAHILKWFEVHGGETDAEEG